MRSVRYVEQSQVDIREAAKRQIMLLSAVQRDQVLPSDLATLFALGAASEPASNAVPSGTNASGGSVADRTWKPFSSGMSHVSPYGNTVTAASSTAATAGSSTKSKAQASPTEGRVTIQGSSLFFKFYSGSTRDRATDRTVETNVVVLVSNHHCRVEVGVIPTSRGGALSHDPSSDIGSSDLVTWGSSSAAGGDARSYILERELVLQAGRHKRVVGPKGTRDWIAVDDPTVVSSPPNGRTAGAPATTGTGADARRSAVYIYRSTVENGVEQLDNIFEIPGAVLTMNTVDRPKAEFIDSDFATFWDGPIKVATSVHLYTYLKRTAQSYSRTVSHALTVVDKPPVRSKGPRGSLDVKPEDRASALGTAASVSAGDAAASTAVPASAVQGAEVKRMDSASSAPPAMSARSSAKQPQKGTAASVSGTVIGTPAGSIEVKEPANVLVSSVSAASITSTVAGAADTGLTVTVESSPGDTKTAESKSRTDAAPPPKPINPNGTCLLEPRIQVLHNLTPQVSTVLSYLDIQPTVIPQATHSGLTVPVEKFLEAWREWSAAVDRSLKN